MASLWPELVLLQCLARSPPEGVLQQKESWPPWRRAVGPPCATGLSLQTLPSSGPRHPDCKMEEIVQNVLGFLKFNCKNNTHFRKLEITNEQKRKHFKVIKNHPC
ncbi:unnamed protein product [Rangifer tarandus platyrhynchus]|uniref:Uncharacterized protein n=1 Tax=Rangifer tarandus platyrhynchus TaxID=3082113 RepID=A0AC59Z586_RANTA